MFSMMKSVSRDYWGKESDFTFVAELACEMAHCHPERWIYLIEKTAVTGHRSFSIIFWYSFALRFWFYKCHSANCNVYEMHSQIVIPNSRKRAMSHSSCLILLQPSLISPNFHFAFITEYYSVPPKNQLNGSVKEPNMFHNYKTEKITREASYVIANLQLYRVVRFFHPRSLCTTTHLMLFSERPPIYLTLPYHQ